MNKNRGLTLVELLVVVVIIGVVAGFVGVAAATSGSSSAKKSATMIDSYIGELRINCMSRAGSPYALLYIKDAVLVGEYYEHNTLVSEETLSDKRVSVSYKAGAVGAEAAMGGAGSPLKISFYRSTGALKKPIETGELKVFISGGSKSYTVTVIAVTGSYDME